MIALIICLLIFNNCVEANHSKWSQNENMINKCNESLIKNNVIKVVEEVNQNFSHKKKCFS